LPVVAPAGTVVLILVFEFTVKVAAVPLKVTAVAPVKLLPVIVTMVPTLQALQWGMLPCGGHSKLGELMSYCRLVRVRGC